MKNFYKLFNSGSSAGAKKGWTRRGLGKSEAMRAKIVANPKFGDYQKVKKGADTLSENAIKSGDPGEHDLAYDAHSGAHEIAEAKQDRPALRYHERKMAFHEKASRRIGDRNERKAVDIGLRAAMKLHRDLGN
jgi:hypothetical protein